MRKNILIIMLCIAIIGCDKKDDDDDLLDKIDSYPIVVGNEWTYRIESITKEYDSESFDKIINIDTFTVITYVSVTKDTILNDLIEVRQIKTTISNTVNYRYVNLDSEGLKEYGYFNQGFNNIYIYEIPKLEVKLPLYKNSNWINYYPQGLIGTQIEKEVVSSEVVKIENKDYLCFKIQKYNDSFSGVEMFEWISKDGLIKSQEIYGENELQFGDGSKKYIQITNTTILSDLKLN